MSFTLNTLAPNKGAKHRRMRVGRGIGSGKGKTCGRGGKGQTARSGVAIKGFEGGQTPIHRRLPKRGFNNPNAPRVQTINIWEIENAIASGQLSATSEINAESLKAVGILRGQYDSFKLLAHGEVKTKFTVVVDSASQVAVDEIKKFGGKVILSAKKEVVKTDKKSQAAAGITKKTVAKKSAKK